MSTATSFESQPIIVDGVMYVTSPHGHVFALDAATGAHKWTFNPEIPPLSELAICCGQTNRGVAVGNGKVFVGQLDATLVALDAATGQVVWRVIVDRWQDRWTETMAPLFLDGKVIIGASGGEFMRRGHVRAYDAGTGRMLWEFFTVPGPGEFGNDTWTGESWRSGGGTVWTTPVSDPQLGLIYITTGNAAPDENGSEREGMNLFTASVVALDINTGQRRWHFQEVHHDIWDYDSPQPAQLFTLERNGQQIPAIGHANKNGFYFILDRRDGKPLYDVKETPVPTEPAWQHPWPTQPVPATEPLIPQSIETAPAGMRTGPMYTVPQELATAIQPGFESGPEWPPSAYSPRTRFAYLQAGGYQPSMYRAIPPVVNSFGSTGGGVANVENYGLFVAMDTTTGRIAWRKRLPEKMFSGVAASGDLVFFGENNGRFNAVDAKTGDTLWTFKSDMEGVGGANGAPAVYVVNGRQYVVMAFGGNNGLQGSFPGDALIAFALPQSGQTQPNVVRVEPRQVDTGAIPESAMQEPLKSAPSDARVVELVTFDSDFHPQSFTALAGEKIAIHLVNSGPGTSNFTMRLPSGPVALRGTVAANDDAYLVFTAPDEPGVYEFFGPQRFQGMTGQMRVGPACPTSATPCVSTTGVVSGAGMRPGAVAPGQIVTVFGRGIGPDKGVVAPNVLGPDNLPFTLGGTQVLFSGIAAPLLYAQANQVNAIVPFEMADRQSAEIAILHDGQSIEPVKITIVEAQPGIFTTKGAGSGQAIVLNQDGSVNSGSNPAAKGSVISIFATGAGQTNPPGVNGGFVFDDSVMPQSRVEVLIGGIGGQDVVARTPRGVFAGILRVSVRVPANAPTGAEIPVTLAVGEVISPPATVALQ